MTCDCLLAPGLPRFSRHGNCIPCCASSSPGKILQGSGWTPMAVEEGLKSAGDILLFTKSNSFFFFFLVCRSYSAVVHFWRNLDLGLQELKQLAPEERWKSFMEAAQILAKAFVAQDILSEGSTHETYQLLVAFTTMRDLNPMPLPLVDYFKFIR